MSRIKLVAVAVIYPSLVGACLFGAAGRFDLPAFWAYLALFAAYIVTMGAIMDTGLARERMRQRNARLVSVMFLAIVHWVVAGLDAGRYHWSPALPVWLQTAALVAMAFSFLLTGSAVRVNTFFSSVIRIQTDRGHRVISDGPYRWVRHPGYAAMILSAVASGMALGSLTSMFVAIVAIPAVLSRLLAEDRTLKAELPGYTQYAERVRYRLAPRVW